MKRLADIPLAPADRAAIEEASRLLRSRFPIEQIVLFGSKSRGDSDGESDIDLLVLTGQPLTFEQRDAVVEALFPIQLAHGVVLSPLVVSAQEWHEGLLTVHPIHAEIDEQGAAV